MLVYAVIMFLTGILFALLGTAIYRGRTDLIHAYHQEKVKEPKAYGKAFGKAMFVIAAALLASGIISLLGNADRIILIAVAVLLIGMGIGIGCIVAVQIKYNKGIF